ncbi:uncharacterized protein DSM5745_10334 [Aspergillus mulundensis]|uniref:Integral membrane protein n=1 Tax=Aspergillus mulundensis TaxID=1810919 RepID=A0A3D8QN23_9EURO|nr:hypothetical protein DSM5745_10334 [Aspergillus mulundensis]RDW63223.1 hypothetical protein DSM5745_10334 [Aspergillus mulundensis]
MPATTTVTLQRARRGRYRPVGHALRNNLLAGVGYLELANAGDFAANVWNEIPVPRHAMILMAIGGPIALLVSLVAARDFYLSWRNVSLLYAERKALQAMPYRNDKTAAILGVNARELGTEVIDRMLMDLFLGFGALLVGTGTIMAIFGANHRVFLASNLLSGFIGNGCAALFGVFNAFWSAYLVYRFQLRYAACERDSNVGSVQTKLRHRVRRFQWHAGVNGVNGLVSGMASMVTARMWWGYVVLIPCVIVMIASNLFWKWKLGYDRPILLAPLNEVQTKEKTGVEDESAVDILDLLAAVKEARSELQGLGDDCPFETKLAFISENQMLEAFCIRLARRWPVHHLFAATEVVTVSLEDLKHLLDEDAKMKQETQGFLRKEAMALLEHRERYLLELIGEVVRKGGMHV